MKYWLYDEEEGELWGEFDSVQEAVEATFTLRERDYYICEGEDFFHISDVVVDVDEFERLVAKHWEE